ncbi:hypothetical protein HMPREF1584_00742 [Gardnerella vaginalis JCP8481A]|uniref:Uncharacterized protein n=1 Tax=Gardnerella vaginalis TaxID=2702 RepID=A0A133NUT2_GARVA|nr:hypothetical protein HMPREF1585_00985 [Gardnerella vaginalis JCP8481B]EPI42966.1 hypothetical protein HMPREF1584_00742 [Gardnerella vaginalis JCP8481A]KXA20037.1 hypothetical protein HMPREF3208_00876 [Gardnerella vaginalis]
MINIVYFWQRGVFLCVIVDEFLALLLSICQLCQHVIFALFV